MSIEEVVDKQRTEILDRIIELSSEKDWVKMIVDEYEEGDRDHDDWREALINLVRQELDTLNVSDEALDALLRGDLPTAYSICRDETTTYELTREAKRLSDDYKRIMAVSMELTLPYKSRGGGGAITGTRVRFRMDGDADGSVGGGGRAPSTSTTAATDDLDTEADVFNSRLDAFQKSERLKCRRLAALAKHTNRDQVRERRFAFKRDSNVVLPLPFTP